MFICRHTFILFYFIYFFAQASQQIFQEGVWLDGGMMKWREMCSSEWQNPHNLLWTAPLWSGWTRAEAPAAPDLSKRAAGAWPRARSPRESKRNGGGTTAKRPREEKLRQRCSTSVAVTHALSACGRHVPPCLNSVNCIWCRCFPNQADHLFFVFPPRADALFFFF